jgi:hypothetical protein
MTIVACWLNRAQAEQLWAVSDTLVSDEGGGATTSLLDVSSKLFQVPVICRKPDASGFYNEVYHTHSIGLAFSGSSLVGLNLVATLSSITTQLGGAQSSTVPSLADIANLACRLAQKYIFSLGQSRGRVERFEGAVFGYCHVAQSYRAFRFKPMAPDNPTMVLSEENLHEEGYVLLMGDKIEEIRSRITATRREATGIMWHRAPKTVVQGVIASREFPTIGGYLQMGIGTPSGFFLLSVCVPVFEGEPSARILFRGLDIDAEIGHVGGCSVAIPAMV